MTPSRVHFAKQLAQLNEDVLYLGSMARHAVERSLQALATWDADLAREVIAADPAINRLRYDVEAECYTLLATEQPVAGDLRAIVSALTVSNDLERIGDHGKKTARICLRMQQEPKGIPLGDIPRLGEMGLAMLDRALQAYSSGDTAEAQAVCRDDDAVDALYRQTFNVVLSYMIERPRWIGAGTQLIQVMHELERVADRATNVAERVIYSVTGDLIDLNT
jgi:phosphate transport system protein